MIGGLAFDHTVTVWRSTESRGSLREVIRSWAKVPAATGVRIGFQTKRERREDPGGGERTTGEYAGYAPASLDVEEGDVIQVLAGPSAPMQVEVDSAYPPRGHHMQLVLIEWKGTLE